MNKNFLVCAAIAAGLLLVACSKKEEPQETEQTTEVASEPIELKPLEQPTEVVIEETIVVPEEVAPVAEPRKVMPETEPMRTEIPTESNNTSATDNPSTTAVETKPTQPKPVANGKTQSEDDAVAAAIAAATPALNN